jgi:hypothetical protein
MIGVCQESYIEIVTEVSWEFKCPSRV